MTITLAIESQYEQGNHLVKGKYFPSLYTLMPPLRLQNMIHILIFFLILLAANNITAK